MSEITVYVGQKRVTVDAFISQAQAEELGLSVGSIMSASLNGGSHLAQYHPGQEEVSEMKDMLEMVSVRDVVPGKFFLRNGDIVEITKVTRQLTVQGMGKDASPIRQDLETVNESASDTEARLNVMILSARNNKLEATNLTTGNSMNGFQRDGIYRLVNKKVILKKFVPAHVHDLTSRNEGRCYTVATCSICGATESCDSSD